MTGSVLSILVYREERLVAAHRFSCDVVRIGRDAACEIQLVDASVKPLHGVIERSDDGWCLVDVEQGGEMLLHAGGGANEEGWLAADDMLQVGPYLLQVVGEQALVSAERELEARAQRQREAEEQARPKCAACGSRDARVVVQLHAEFKAPDVTVDDPDAFRKLRGEVCSACGHVSLFLDPAAIVPRD
jgi:hypothetical protein